MRILTIHPTTSGASRLIPLYVLQKRYISRLESTKNLFLVPKRYHKSLKESGIDILDIDNSIDYEKAEKCFASHDNINSKDLEDIQIKLKTTIYDAIEVSKPDLIIEDFEAYTVLPCKKFNIPRVSIHRTGQFRSIPSHLRNPNHFHSCEKSVFDSKKYDASLILGNNQHKLINAFEDSDLLFEYPFANAKIIPGIRSIEVLPEDILDKDSYFYSGPLTVEDNPSKLIIEELNQFFYKSKDTKVVFITTGLVDNTPISEYVDILLRKNYAVISTVKIDVDIKYLNKCLFNSMLPLNYICSNADLIIHQCGSGIYHYPILNEKPAITIGTRCYDREDIAIQMELLGISKHTPNKLDDSRHLEIFQKHLDSFENETLCDFSKLKELKEEIFETMLSFDIKEVFDYATKNKLKNI